MKIENGSAMALSALRSYLSSHDTAVGDALLLQPLTAGHSSLWPFRVCGPVLERPIFAKITADKTHFAKLAKETENTAIAAKVGVSPPVLARHAGVLLTDFVDATHLRSIDINDDATMRIVMHALARLHRAGDHYEVPSRSTIHPQRRIRMRLAEARRKGRITHGEASYIVNEGEKSMQALARFPDRQAYIHGDFHKNNIFFANNRVWFIDFEDAGLGDPAFDLAHLATSCDLTPSALPRLAALYCEASQADYAETVIALKLSYHLYSLWDLLWIIGNHPSEAQIEAGLQRAYDRSAALAPLY